MKRIFTSFAAICLLAISQNATAQTGCTTTETFQATTTHDFTSGIQQFSGNFDWIPADGVIGAVKGDRSLTSASYFLFQTQSLLYWSFDIGSNGGKIDSWKAYLELANNPASSVLVCSGTALSSGTQKFKIVIPAQFKGQNVKIRMDFAVSSPGNSNKYVYLDNFKTNTTAAITLPVNFTGIEARKVSNGTQITWNVAQEEGVVNYYVEKSTDGSNFSKVGVVPATVSSSYTYVDNQPSANTAYYRVKSNDKDGKQKYSSTIKVDGSKASFVRNVYPMPATTEVFIQHNAAPAGTTVSLLSQDGRLIQRLQVQNGSLQTRVDLSSLRPGLYMVRFDNDSNNTEPLKIIKQ